MIHPRDEHELRRKDRHVLEVSAEVAKSANLTLARCPKCGARLAEEICEVTAGGVKSSRRILRCLRLVKPYERSKGRKFCYTSIDKTYGENGPLRAGGVA